MAGWEDDPATDKQKSYAKDLGVELQDGCTKGEASSLIDEAIHRQDDAILTTTVSIGTRRSFRDWALDKLAGFLSIASWILGIAILFSALYFLSKERWFTAGFVISLAIIVVIYGTRWYRKRTSMGSKGNLSYEPDPVHAIPGSFDESYFVNPKTGYFQFPKYKHDDKYLVKITDQTDYRYIWEDYDSQEKRAYALQDFEMDFVDPEIEVDGIKELFYKSSKIHLIPLDYLKGQWGLMEILLNTGENDWILLDSDSKAMVQLLKDGYLLEQVIVTDEDKLKLLNQMPQTRITEICSKSGIKIGKSIQDTIDRLISAGNQAKLPQVVIPSPALEEWFSRLVARYVEELRRNVQRFHPLYHGPIWDAALDEADLPSVKRPIEEVIQSKYWLSFLKK